MQTKHQLSDEEKRKVENALNLVSRVTFHNVDKYGTSDIDASNFNEWMRWTSSLKNPDAVRNALYYGFQPLYDLLVDRNLSPEAREKGVEVFKHIKAISTEYLTGYYTGRPDVALVRNAVKNLETHIINLDGMRYWTKFRNVDSNGVFPENILSYLNSFFEYINKGNLFVPQYVIGCACGSSEIAFPLAGLLSVDVGFIRKSKRRNDYTPKIIPEQKSEIQGQIMNHKVLCIEDYVCTGKSLRTIMDTAKEFRASAVAGASVRFSKEGDYLKEVYKATYLHVFK